jgi:hypothetical protein
MKHSEAKFEYAFGKITIKVGGDGPVERLGQVTDHMLATVTTVMGVEVIQHNISGSQRDDNRFQQTYSMTTEFGDVTVEAIITFDLNGSVSKKTLNDVVLSSIFPNMLRTAGIYLGDHQLFTSPPAPMASVPREEVQLGLGRVLGIDQTPEPHAMTSGDQRQLQTTR